MPAGVSDFLTIRARSQPAASQNRRFTQSPIDSLVNLKVGCRLALLVPVRLDRNTPTGMRIADIPQLKDGLKNPFTRALPGNHAAIIAFRKVTLKVNIIYG